MAEVVIGARPIGDLKHFSLIKKALQRIGSFTVRLASKTNVADAPSGFRAYSREAAMRLNVFNSYTYTLETIIQAGQKNMAIISVPIRVNGNFRSSRLLKNNFSYAMRSIGTIFRIFSVYRPFLFFMSIGSPLFLCGLALGMRFLFYYRTGGGTGHVQSLILASILLGIGFQTMLVAFLADLLGVGRSLLEEIQYSQKKLGYRSTAERRPRAPDDIDR